MWSTTRHSGRPLKIRAIRNLLSHTIKHVRHHAPKIYTRELIDLFFAQPYCRIENLVEAGIAKRQTASMYLAVLIDMRVLEPIQAGREKLFIHRALVDLLLENNDGVINPRSPGSEGTAVNIVDEALRLDLNRAGSLDDKLRCAIGNQLLIQLRYSAKTRVVEPHDFGVQKGTARLLAFQRGGTGDMHGRSVSGWRLFDVAKIEACVVLGETFAGSRGALHEHHYVWDQLYARVE